MNNSGVLDYTRAKIACSGKEVAHGAVVNYREWVTTKSMQ